MILITNRALLSLLVLKGLKIIKFINLNSKLQFVNKYISKFYSAKNVTTKYSSSKQNTHSKVSFVIFLLIYYLRLVEISK